MYCTLIQSTLNPLLATTKNGAIATGNIGNLSRKDVCEVLTYHKIHLLQISQQTFHLLRTLAKPQIIADLGVERKVLDLLNQLRVTEKLRESLDTGIIDFRMVDSGRCVEEDDVAVEVDQGAEGVDEVVLLCEVFTRLLAGVQEGVDFWCGGGEETAALQVPCKVCDGGLFGEDVLCVRPLELAWWGRFNGFCETVSYCYCSGGFGTLKTYESWEPCPLKLL